MGRSGVKAAAVAFRPLSVVDSPALACSHDISPLQSGCACAPSSAAKSHFVASVRNLMVAGALALSALGVGASAAHAGAVRTDAAFAANALPRNDDGSTDLVDLGFNANFFGTTYNQLYVNNNGNVTFDNLLDTFTPFNLTSTNRVIIAPFFADVDTRGAGSQPTRYGQTFGASMVNGRPAFGANYINVGYYAAKDNKLNSFQVVLIDRADTGAGNFDIELNYDKIQWETGDASGGNNGLGGNSARAGFSNGSGNLGTSFELPGSAVNGAFLDSNRSTGLIYNSLNSNVPGRYVFQVRSGQVARTLSISDASVTEGNSGTVNANFTVTLSPASDQTVTVAYATADGTAKQPGDYTAKSGTLTFAPGDTTKTLSIAVKGDTLVEPDETFVVNLSGATGGATLGDAQGKGTIVNDDVNRAPVVSNIAVSTNEDTAFTFSAARFDAGFSDADAGDALQSVRVDSLPANGTLTLSGANVTANQVIARANLGNLTFVPNSNFHGATSFKYNASDGTNFAATNANVNITVTSVNDAPTILDIPNKTINEDGTTGVIPFTVFDVDNDAATLTVSATSSNTALVPVANIIFGGSGTNRTVRVTPVADGFGTATITVTVSDGSLNASDSFVLTVNSVNDVPSFTLGADQVVAFNAGAQSVTGFATNISPGPANESGQTVAFIVTNTNNALFVTQPTISANGTLSYNSAANKSGSATVTVKIKDNGGTANGGVDTSAAQSFTITVTAGNQPPSVNPTIAPLSPTTNQTVTVTPNGSDAEGDALTYLYTFKVNGVTRQTGSSASFDLNASGNGNVGDTISATVVANDGQNNSAPMTVTVTVANSAPTLANASLSGTTGLAFSQQLSGSDADGQALTYAVTGGALPGGLSLSASGLISGTPTSANSFSATVSVSDGTASGSATISFLIAQGNVANTPPVLDNGILSATVGQGFSYPLVGFDAEGDTLNYAKTSGNLPPGVSLAADGTLSGTPGQTGVFSFGVTVSDGNGGTSVGQFNLTVGTKADGVAPVLTLSRFSRTVTRDQLAALTLSGTVRDIASTGVTPAGVLRVQVQLRRNSDGYAYNGRVFGPSLSPYYVANLGAASPSTSAGTRSFSRSLGFVPSSSVLNPGSYTLVVVALDREGNYSGTAIPLTIVAPSAPQSAPQSAPRPGFSGGAS